MAGRNANMRLPFFYQVLGASYEIKDTSTLRQLYLNKLSIVINSAKDKTSLTQQSEELYRAYTILSDPLSRAEYDEGKRDEHSGAKEGGKPLDITNEAALEVALINTEKKRTPLSSAPSLFPNIASTSRFQLKTKLPPTRLHYSMMGVDLVETKFKETKESSASSHRLFSSFRPSSELENLGQEAITKLTGIVWVYNNAANCKTIIEDIILSKKDPTTEDLLSLNSFAQELLSKGKPSEEAVRIALVNFAQKTRKEKYQFECR